MHFFEVIRRRRSVRAFRPKPVATDTLRTILQAASTAPSDRNLQSYEIYVVTDDLARMALAHAANDQFFVSQASAAIVFCAHNSVPDATIACAFAMLAATALGLGSVWVGDFQTSEVRGVLRAPDDVDPIAILPLGYATEEPAASPRRRLEDLVHYMTQTSTT